MSTNEMTASERGNLRPHTNGANGQEQNGETRSAFQAALEQIERIKAKLRALLGDLNDAANVLKTAEKEQRAATKEIEAVRTKLREIQSLEI